MLTTWLRKTKDHPELTEFPNVKRVADKVLQRESVQKVYAEWIVDPQY